MGTRPNLGPRRQSREGWGWSDKYDNPGEGRQPALPFLFLPHTVVGWAPGAQRGNYSVCPNVSSMRTTKQPCFSTPLNLVLQLWECLLLTVRTKGLQEGSLSCAGWSASPELTQEHSSFFGQPRTTLG